MDTRTWGPATVLLAVLAVIVVLVGGVIAIVNPSTLSFAQYLNDLKTFALAAAGLGIGRGLHLGLKAHAPQPLTSAVLTVGSKDEDELPHIPPHPGNVPADEGDKGAA